MPAQRDRALALALAFSITAVAWTVLSSNTRADDAPPGIAQPRGPWIDEIVWSEERDRSKALTDVIAGNQHMMMFDITTLADRERAVASDQIGTFPAYRLFDELSMNPVERSQTAGFPRNPFAVRAVREAMHYLIDRDFVVREIYAGFAIPYRTVWHPRSPDYGRAIDDLLKLEDKYAFDPEKGKDQMFTALEAAGWSIQQGTDAGGRTCPLTTGCWRDPEGRVVTLKIMKRVQDERLQLGTYYANILRGLNFKVEEIGAFLGPYGTPPEEEQWNIYTAGWISFSTTPWDDDRLKFYAACGIGEIYCTPGDPSFYDPPPALQDIANTIALRQYGNLDERAR